MDATPPSDSIALAKALAASNGEVPACAPLDALPEEARAAVEGMLRSLGTRLLEIEAEHAHAESNLVDLRTILKGVSRVKRELKAENKALRARHDANLRPVIGADGGLREVMRVADKVLFAPIPVLITGETGTGKEVIARYLHGHGPRSDGPFVAINCAALPEQLLEAELFGIEKGVATGVSRRAGKLEEADGGTLFLDEVGDMPLTMQAKILRVLQEREVARVGGSQLVPVDVRVISATHQDLPALVREGGFREDLYYRLVGVHLHIPPLRKRPGDIDALVAHFLPETAERFHCPVGQVSDDAMRALRRYRWPGNVRELIAEIQRAVALAETDTVEIADLTPHIAEGGSPLGSPASAAGAEVALPLDDKGELMPLREGRRLFERRYVEEALARGRSRKGAAKLLGITTEGLRRKLIALEMLDDDGD